MTPEQDMVTEFMVKFKQEVRWKPGFPASRVQVLRMELIKEEFLEFETAMVYENLEQVVDALGDLIYVALGCASAFGVDMEPIIKEIHRANMSKEGGVQRKDGKWLKPDGWTPPNIKGILEKQSK